MGVDIDVLLLTAVTCIALNSTFHTFLEGLMRFGVDPRRFSCTSLRKFSSLRLASWHRVLDLDREVAIRPVVLATLFHAMAVEAV